MHTLLSHRSQLARSQQPCLIVSEWDCVKKRAARRGWGTSPIMIAVTISSTEWWGGGVERCGGGSDPQLRLCRAVQIPRKIPAWGWSARSRASGLESCPEDTSQTSETYTGPPSKLVRLVVTSLRARRPSSGCRSVSVLTTMLSDLYSSVVVQLLLRYL
jgi:hypothetical protein